MLRKQTPVPAMPGDQPSSFCLSLLLNPLNEWLALERRYPRLSGAVSCKDQGAVIRWKC